MVKTGRFSVEVLAMKNKAAALLIILLLVSVAGAGGGLAQKKEKKPKPWTEWSKKEADRMLHDSPWARTQMVADAAALFASADAARTAASGRRSRSVNTEQSAPLDFYLCLLSAKPIRQAWARRIELLQKKTE
jgi:hypothetical protein